MAGVKWTQDRRVGCDALPVEQAEDRLIEFGEALDRRRQAPARYDRAHVIYNQVLDDMQDEARWAPSPE